MPDDIDYITGSKTDHLYVHPGKQAQGAYVKIIGDSEEFIGEINVTSRSKIAVSAFYVRDRADFGTLKIRKLKWHAIHGWLPDGEIQVNHFQIAQMREFVAIISSLDLRDARKTRISLGENIDVSALGSLLSSSKGAELIRSLAKNPEFHHDIYAVAAKREALAQFERNLESDLTEPEWQEFFELNPWIFGHGLHYTFLNKIGAKLETQTTGSSFDHPGKRADALLQTKAEVSQYVLVEIKRNSTDLLRKTEYRSGCWAASDELSNAVTQTQKTVFDFSRNRFRDHLKDKQGNDLDASVYSIEPRSFLVIGNWEQLAGNDDKIACFELYRRNLRAPEILTFDELFHRARFIVENISKASSGTEEGHPDDENVDIPF